jgi:hypothetical protein
MRLLLRIVGTLLIACAVILLIIDGTKSLAANGLVFTSLQATWTQINAQSLASVKDFLGSRLFGALLEVTVNFVLDLPGWVVLGVPGILLAWAGRSRRTRIYLRQDQI